MTKRIQKAKVKLSCSKNSNLQKSDKPTKIIANISISDNLTNFALVIAHNIQMNEGIFVAI